jgi:hypothetical protein
VLHLSAFRATETDDSSDLAALHEGHVVKGVSKRSQRDHPQLLILETLIDPDQRGIPIELLSQRQRYPMLGNVRNILRGVEFDQRELL